MTASQQPDAEHAPLTSPEAAGSGSTGHDKAVEAVMAVHWTAARHGQLCPVWTMSRSKRKPGPLDQCNCWVKPQSEDILSAALAALRAALAAGDANVAEALGLRVERQSIPVAESGERWVPRSRQEAEDCLRNYPPGILYSDGSPAGGVAHIVNERRFVTDWTEAP